MSVSSLVSNEHAGAAPESASQLAASSSASQLAASSSASRLAASSSPEPPSGLDPGDHNNAAVKVYVRGVVSAAKTVMVFNKRGPPTVVTLASGVEVGCEAPNGEPELIRYVPAAVHPDLAGTDSVLELTVRAGGIDPRSVGNNGQLLLDANSIVDAHLAATNLLATGFCRREDAPDGARYYCSFPGYAPFEVRSGKTACFWELPCSFEHDTRRDAWLQSLDGKLPALQEGWLGTNGRACIGLAQDPEHQRKCRLIYLLVDPSHQQNRDEKNQLRFGAAAKLLAEAVDFLRERGCAIVGADSAETTKTFWDSPAAHKRFGRREPELQLARRNVDVAQAIAVSAAKALRLPANDSHELVAVCPNNKLPERISIGYIQAAPLGPNIVVEMLNLNSAIHHKIAQMPIGQWVTAPDKIRVNSTIMGAKSRALNALIWKVEVREYRGAVDFTNTLRVIARVDQ